MNALDKFLAMIGLSSERFEKMSEAEQANLTTISATHASLEQERDTAVSTLEAAQTQINELSASIATAQEENAAIQSGLTETQTALEAANALATDLQGQIVTLNAKLAAKPSADGTVIVKEGENLPGEQKKVIRSWEKPLYR
jgi:chromosome segregation ATPase